MGGRGEMGSVLRRKDGGWIHPSYIFPPPRDRIGVGEGRCVWAWAWRVN